MSICIKDFQPINNWHVDLEGHKFDTGEPQFIIDESIGRKYLNEDNGIIRFKCFLLTFGTPIIHAATSLVNIAYRILKLVSFYHFWAEKPEEKSYDFQARLFDASIDLLRIFTQPFAYIGLELAAIYGVFDPLNGRKIYATIERAQYGNFILAPCFQPEPEEHLLGGDLNQRNAF